MPKAETCNFGVVTYREEDVIEFPAGLPGLEDQKRLVPLQVPDSSPLVFLQSLTRPDLCFITLPANGIDPDYTLDVSPEDLRALDLPESRQPQTGSEVLCLAIVCLSEDEPMTANLLAPLVINIRTRRGVQAIRSDGAYSHRHLLEALEEAACS